MNMGEQGTADLISSLKCSAMPPKPCSYSRQDGSKKHCKKTNPEHTKPAHVQKVSEILIILQNLLPTQLHIHGSFLQHLENSPSTDPCQPHRCNRLQQATPQADDSSIRFKSVQEERAAQQATGHGSITTSVAEYEQRTSKAADYTNRAVNTTQVDITKICDQWYKHPLNRSINQ
jgi:hypothetical protein|uniref:Uncharacterized protein n=1 Tax=Eutreptiella gymnastica TaxID=73025 RepID=A0A7S4CUY3_9EUGL|mmetsp:Transcript_34728/g.57891  ORF Transcript_34728/g.57891 Transcript_34728/m.57891 type:complete len:175 (+) Transcript_34728:1016-1540(+)